MRNTFKYMVVVVVTMGIAVISSADSSSDSSHRVSKLIGYSGQGFCSVEQNGSKVKASVKVFNITPGSTTTAWLKFDGSTVGRLDGTVADDSGAAIFNSTFDVDSNVSSYIFDVRDHNRQLSSIFNDDDLMIELNQPTNIITGESIRMGICKFDNIFHSNNQYRYIRLMKSGNNPGGNYINLSEVEVIDSGGINRALAGTASQSSTYARSTSYYDADRCIDGFNGSTYFICATEGYTSNEWWQVDLGDQYSISEIRIINRGDCCQDRLSNVYVLVSDTPFPNTTDLSSARANADYEYQIGSVSVSNPHQSVNIGM